MALKFLNQFKKDVAKLDTVGVGIRTTENWLSSGNYALNRIMSGNFFNCWPEGKIGLLAGPSGCVPEDEVVLAAFIDNGPNTIPEITTEGETRQRITELITVEQAKAFVPNADDVQSAFQEYLLEKSQMVSIGQVREAILAGKTVFVDSIEGFTQVIRFIEKTPREIYEVDVGEFISYFSNDHLVQTDKGWTFVDRLTIGDPVIVGVDDGELEFLVVQGVSKAYRTEDNLETVYDLEVSNITHSYIVGGISSHNSGKSFLAGNAVVQAQKDGYHVLYLDSEHAVDVDYLKKIGAKIDEEYLTYISVTTIEDVNKVLSSFFVGYKKEYGKNNKEAPKTLIVLDSLAMLSSETEMDNYNKATGGIIKGDQGQLAKRRKAMLRLAVGQIGNLPITMLLTDHVYPQDPLLGDGAWAITNSTKFSTSVIGVVTKLKLREESEVVGVRMRVETYKSRFAKLGSKVELEVPYNTGMSPLSGLVELFETMGVIAKGTQPGEKTKWIAEWTDAETGEIHREAFLEREFTEEIAVRIMKGHPLCKPMAGRGGTEEEDDLAKLLADDSDDTVE